VAKGRDLLPPALGVPAGLGKFLRRLRKLCEDRLDLLGLLPGLLCVPRFQGLALRPRTPGLLCAHSGQVAENRHLEPSHLSPERAPQHCYIATLRGLCATLPLSPSAARGPAEVRELVVVSGAPGGPDFLREHPITEPPICVEPRSDVTLASWSMCPLGLGWSFALLCSALRCTDLLCSVRCYEAAPVSAVAARDGRGGRRWGAL
jgi:hypothetical protein